MNNHGSSSYKELLTTNKAISDYPDLMRSMELRERTLAKLNVLIIDRAAQLGYFSEPDTPSYDLKETAQYTGQLLTAKILGDKERIKQVIGWVYSCLVITAEVRGLSHSIDLTSRWWGSSIDDLAKEIINFHTNGKFHYYRRSILALSSFALSEGFVLIECVNYSFEETLRKEKKLGDGFESVDDFLAKDVAL